MSAEPSSAPLQCRIDHMVLLLSDADFESPPPWLADNFTIIEGGTHAGGSSRNKLIIFKDGTYLELLNWLNRSQGNFPDWTWRPEGSYIDFALTTLPPIDAESCWKAVQDGLQGVSNGLHVGYESPKAGGRKRMDGTEIAWKTSRPKFTSNASSSKRLDLPFFCHDTTERKLRVPHDDPNVTNHPCGAVGTTNVDVVVPRDLYAEYVKSYMAVLGKSPAHAESKTMAIFEIGVPYDSEGHGATITVKPEEPTSDNEYLNSNPKLGIRGVTLLVRGEQGQEKSLHGGIDRTSVPVLNLQS